MNYVEHTKHQVHPISLSPSLITQINGQAPDRCNCPLCRFQAQIMVT